MIDRITITRPDDWHLHLRDGRRMAAVVTHTQRQFARAIVMPNLSPPVTNVTQARAYHERIVGAATGTSSFSPLMTLYLTDQTTAADIDAAVADDVVYACKLYPAGATTNSESGVTRIDAIYPALERMAETGLPLLIHGEVTDPDVDVFDRERVFIDRVMSPLRDRYARLRIVFEHITTTEAVQFVMTQSDNMAATITPQHLLLTRNDLLAGGLRPHNYCIPVLKTHHDRESLLKAATSGDPRFFLGTDSAPHARNEKEAACGCAGVYTAHAAIELYAEAFDSVNALPQLEGFASFHGADYYGLPRNKESITLVRRPQTVEATYAFADEPLVPFRANTTLEWSLLDE